MERFNAGVWSQHATLLHAAVSIRADIIANIEQTAQKHPLYPLMADAPGLGALTAGRIIGELGDDLGRFPKRGSMSRLAGVVPVTYQSNETDRKRAKKSRNPNLAQGARRSTGGA